MALVTSPIHLNPNLAKSICLYLDPPTGVCFLATGAQKPPVRVPKPPDLEAIAIRLEVGPGSFSCWKLRLPMKSVQLLPDFLLEAIRVTNWAENPSISELEKGPQS